MDPKTLKTIINKYNPIAIVQKGSRMLQTSFLTSDNDFGVLLPLLKNNPPKNAFKGYDIWFEDLDLNVNCDIFKEISKLQWLFVNPKHVIYTSKYFDLNNIKTKVQKQLNNILFAFCERYINYLRYETYKKDNAKVFYHIAYVSTVLLKEPLPIDIIKKIKQFTADKNALNYLEKHKAALLKWYLSKFNKENKYYAFN